LVHKERSVPRVPKELQYKELKEPKALELQELRVCKELRVLTAHTLLKVFKDLQVHKVLVGHL
jgi:hypothetical protein